MAQLAAEADAFAQAFAQHASGARIVPILAGKSATTVAALLGAAASGHAAACLNPKLRAAAGRADPAHGPSPGRRRGRDGTARAQGTPRRRLADPHDALVAPARRGLHGHAREGGRGTARGRGPRRIGRCRIEDCELPALEPDSPAVCLFTSGSTGVPKGVLVGRQDLLERAETEIEWFGLTERDVLLSVLPFSFDVGLNQLMASLVAGATLVILDSWMPADILRAVAERGVTGISAVPSIWLDFLQAGLAL